MTYQQLAEQVQKKHSFLCVGLDPDSNKMPGHVKAMKQPVFEFNRRIVDATADRAIAFKPNLAFYETLGKEGWHALKQTVAYIRHNYPEIFLIADAKRGDIGNTAGKYAEAFFQDMAFDAVTLSPYMGGDAILPFLEYPGKWAIILALTSNASAGDFQTAGNPPLYKRVMQKAAHWGDHRRIMFVVGATRAEALREIRMFLPDHFLLVPGIGAQGGSLADVAANGLNRQGGLLVNASRSIIYAGSGTDFADKARKSAAELQAQMKALLKEHSIIS